MQIIRAAAERGKADFGWLDSRHTFSFGHYHDPEHMGFGPLRVINEDRVKPGQGFGTHGHQDMEIISYVVAGGLAHRDSLGNGSTIRPGDVQRMSAGTGVQHSEFNASNDESVHFLQIWILPAEKGLQPSYEEQSFAAADRRGKLKLVAAGDARDGAIRIHQDVDLYASLLDAGESVTHELGTERLAWLQVVNGALTVGDQTLAAGDGLAVAQQSEPLTITADEDAEFLLFDMTADWH